MQSKAANVDAYLAEIPKDRQSQLTKLRELIRTTLKGHTESMEYGMPCYTKAGKAEVAFASQKNYISLYIAKINVLRDHKHLLQRPNCGKCCIRYTNPNQLDFGVIATILRAVKTSKEKPC